MEGEKVSSTIKAIFTISYVVMDEILSLGVKIFGSASAAGSVPLP